MRRNVLIMLFSLVRICAIAQTPDSSNELRETLDYMFARIEKTSVPTGFLIDKAIEYENLSIYSPDRGMTDDNLVDVSKYGAILETIKSASMKGNPFLSFEKNMKSAGSADERNSYVRTSISLFEYAQIRANALEKGLISYADGQVICSSAEAYQKNVVCAGCVLDGQKVSSDVVFSLPSNYVLSNIGIKEVEIDYGSGFFSILGHSAKAHLPVGKHLITFKVTDDSGKEYFSHSSLQITSASHVQTRAVYTAYTEADDSLIVTGLPYHGITTAADVSIKFAPGNNSGKLKKPFIFVEGFDPRDFNPNGKGFSNFSDTYKEWKYFTDLQGYDFIYVDWQMAGEYIQANAYTLIEVIKQLNSKLYTTSEPAVLIGHSMGGLVARYALKTMENNNQKHNVGTYISYDSPHMGANIPLSVLYGYHGLKSFLSEKKILSALLDKWTDAERYIAIGDRYAFSTASQQMLMDYVDSAGNLNNSVHAQWQTELMNLGFPNGDSGKEFKMLAIANSDYTLPNIPNKLISCDLSAGSDITTAVAPLLSAAISVLLHDVIAGLLAMLPGRDEINGVFECLPATSVGQRVTHINIGYKKTFLWTIPISKTVFSYDKYQTGSCLYDTYASSSWNLRMSNQNLSVPGYSSILGYFGADIELASGFPFIPTASALAVGYGINNVPSEFSTAPTGTTSPFGEAYYMESNPSRQNHTSISLIAQNWLQSQIGTTINGPSTGYSGAQYSLSKPVTNVVWSSSAPSVASINQQGILSVSGNGLVQLTAKVETVTYTKTIMVGMPKYVLAASHEPDGYRIEANLIASQFSNPNEYINKIVSYYWGIKFPNSQINWSTTNEPCIFVPLEDKAVTAYFKVCDSNGNFSPVQYVSAQAQDVFSATNSTLSVDANKNIYKADGTSYSYKYGKIYLTRNSSLSSAYQHDIWTPTKAEVFSPFSSNYTIPVSKGEISVKNVFPDEELGYVIQNSVTGQSHIYVVALLNPEDKIIQLVPVTITLK